MYNEGQATGMTFWAPNINIFRDPRWGRGQETPGEDPTVAGKYAVSFVRGMQGDRSNHLQVSACCKHFTAYDLENWNGTDHYNFNAIVTKQDMVDTFQPPFKASSVMCAYNSVNGIRNCANKELLTKTLRLEWGFRGYIALDCNAVHRIFYAHNYTKSPEEAAADALKAGINDLPLPLITLKNFECSKIETQVNSNNQTTGSIQSMNIYFNEFLCKAKFSGV
ncbi:unnamed protein product [Cuscuta epithymum]|uniref:Glycoside hydrolase family 3 N-terminal domain-containing protein n=1 Tax=Cuscuta epithymum TaxID=186058 RepID=A0AAV0CDY4_9ASTE|nr:unnamed protein product [Cuscuta epithymum]